MALPNGAVVKASGDNSKKGLKIRKGSEVRNGSRQGVTDWANSLSRQLSKEDFSFTSRLHDSTPSNGQHQRSMYTANVGRDSPMLDSDYRHEQQ
ncbi:hypothetical protein V6N13_003411 [Hibiscus sabdariffa]|uniref:Uncharacterized protein n=2 Tax=Hibiscus sabdariffa TaxID=183260 RepID=A0ABR2NJJ4_9ROSI